MSRWSITEIFGEKQSIAGDRLLEPNFVQAWYVNLRPHLFV